MRAQQRRKWRGEEVGRAIIENLIDDLAEGGEAGGVTQEGLDNMTASFTTREDALAYNAYVDLYEAAFALRTRAQALIQQAYNGYYRLLVCVEQSLQAERLHALRAAFPALLEEAGGPLPEGLPPHNGVAVLVPGTCDMDRLRAQLDLLERPSDSAEARAGDKAQLEYLHTTRAILLEDGLTTLRCVNALLSLLGDVYDVPRLGAFSADLTPFERDIRAMNGMTETLLRPRPGEADEAAAARASLARRAFPPVVPGLPPSLEAGYAMRVELSRTPITERRLDPDALLARLLQSTQGGQDHG
ncbi:hypothetical protein LJC74_03400 [Eubacteriales bacterium OttesenSCG-928-A19]|nr:hypothetical protein [Eubacteriales bacterium OttesenSCG-928-A19]